MAKILRKTIIGAAALAGAAVWAVAPRPFGDKRRNYVPVVPDVRYAHRGLHDAGSGLTAENAAHSGAYVALARRMAMQGGFGTPETAGPIAPENSLAAFAAAAEAGYGIELDLQLTLDGRVVVVHDEDLLRVAGDPRRVCDLTYDELTRIPLFPGCRPGVDVAVPLPGAQERPPLVVTPSRPPEGYYQHVPLFSDVLTVVGGRVPLIVEYKFADNLRWGEDEERLMEAGDRLLQSYDGPYVVESFHPGAMRWYREHRPETCRGQLAEPASPRVGLAEFAGGLLAGDWLSRPDFIAYDWHHGDAPQLRLARAMGAETVSWTVCSQDEMEACDRWFDHHIFEAFVPDGR